MQIIERKIRLQKYLAHSGLCSRRKAEEYIQQGRIRVNHEVITNLGTKVDIKAKDKVFFDDKKIDLKQDKKIYIALNKPKGYITSCLQKKTKIILDLIDIDTRIYPVGRLDKDSTGLVLLTNDGDLHYKLSHPSFNHEKEYIVDTIEPISSLALKKMEEGMMLDDGVKAKTRKAKVKRLKKNKFSIVLKQGRNRQIRKMVEKNNNKVSSLKRIRISNIKLDNLFEGKWRYLTLNEIKKLKA